MISSKDVSMNCDTSENPGSVYNLSKLCVDGSNTTGLGCYPNQAQANMVTTASGFWYAFVGAFGIFGNAMTLIAIPSSAKSKRYSSIHADKIAHLCF